MVILLCAATVFAGCTGSKTASKKSSSSESKRPPSKKGDIKKFSEVITKDAITDEGLFNVHKVDDKHYFEIPDEMLEREILLVTRVSGTTQNLSFGGAGQKARGQQVIRWHRKGDTILLRHVSYSSVADEEDPVYRSVKNNNFEPVIYNFDIEALGKDSTSTVIDVTKLFTTDVKLLAGLSDGQRERFRVRRLDGSRSFIDSVRSYPENIEVRHVLSYDSGNPPDDDVTGTISLEVNQSMILLPKEQMTPRLQDDRVGYFSISQYNYSLDEQKAAERNFITRWKLVPKDKEAYLRGELVEPVEPIVYYLDPATPEKWRKYLIQGIEDWQVAFEEAGFKNAIIGREAPTPEEDPEFSPEDVRYSVIRYITNPIQNAQGPHVHDPRTGQILESDILWYHNVMNLLRNWFFIQTAAANEDARAVKFDDEIMGELIRFVSAHEVGHTLGHPHNWGSSYAYPVDSLRSPTFTSTHGTAPSIMDYARFNYIAQPGDGVTNFYPAVGEYDKWAIKWGYTWFPDIDDPTEESETLNEWIVERADDPRYFYGRQTGNKIDPRSQNEDLGNDAMKAGELGLANLQVITDNLIDWIEEPGEDFDNLEELYANIIGQWSRYMGHVVRYVGGVYEDHKTFDQDGAVYSPVDEQRQRRAMQFLNRHAFSSPTWAFDQEILSRINQSTAVDDFRARQAGVLNTLVDPQRIARLIEFERRAGGDTYTAFEMMDDVREGIWEELEDGEPIDVHRRNLQRAYIERLDELMKEELPNFPSNFREFFGWTQVDVSQSDIRPIAREQLQLLQEDVEDALDDVDDRATRIHLEDVLQRIELIFDPD